MKKIMLIINGIALLFILTSCSEAKQKEDIETVEIKFPIFSPELPADLMAPYDQMLLAAIDNFNGLHPHIKVIAEYTPLLGGNTDTSIFTLESEAPPDIVKFSSMFSFGEMKEAAEKGLLMDLRPLYHAQDLDIPEHLLARGEVNEKMMILPYGVMPRAIYYNKDLFDAAKIDYPQGEWTWDQFRQTARMLDSSNPAIYGAKLAYGIGSLDFMMQSMGQSVLSPDRTTFSGYLDSPEALRAFQWLKISYREETARGLGDSASFMNNKVGMATGTLYYMDYLSTDKPHIGVAPWPYVEGGVRANPMEIVGYGISSKSKHPIEAWEFIKYLTVSVNEDSMKHASYYVPTSNALAEAVRKNANENMLVFMDELDYGTKTMFDHINKAQVFTLEIINLSAEIFEADDADVPELLKDLSRQLDLNM